MTVVTEGRLSVIRFAQQICYLRICQSNCVAYFQVPELKADELILEIVFKRFACKRGMELFFIFSERYFWYCRALSVESKSENLLSFIIEDSSILLFLVSSVNVAKHRAFRLVCDE